jgi:hypothetical protein
VCALAVLGSGADAVLVTASHARLATWQLDTLAFNACTDGLDHWVRALCVADGALFSACHSLVVEWDANLRRQREMQATNDVIHAIAASPTVLLCGTANHEVHVFDRCEWNFLHKLSGHTGTISSIVLSSTGQVKPNQT